MIENVERGKTVLVVDTNPAQLEVLDATLAFLGYRVLIATSVKEGLDITLREENRQLDLVVARNQIPYQGDGGRFIEQLPDPTTPSILRSADPDSVRDDVRKLQRRGYAVELLSSPSSIAELKNAIDKATSLAARLRERPSGLV